MATAAIPRFTDIGLRLRMRSEQRRIVSQHDQLDELFAVVLRALEGDRIETVTETFRHFRDALEAHIELEENVYFPAIHGLELDTERQIESLLREHTDVRDELRQIQDLMDRGERSAAGVLLRDFAESVSEHERREEALVIRIAAAPAAGMPGES